MHGEFWGAEPSLQGFKSVHILNLRVSDPWVSPKDVNLCKVGTWLSRVLKERGPYSSNSLRTSYTNKVFPLHKYWRISKEREKKRYDDLPGDLENPPTGWSFMNLKITTLRAELMSVGYSEVYTNSPSRPWTAVWLFTMCKAPSFGLQKSNDNFL